jgi:hypothetical protein
MKTYRGFCDFIYNAKFIARKNCKYDHERSNDFSENNVRNEEGFTFYRQVPYGSYMYVLCFNICTTIIPVTIIIYVYSGEGTLFPDHK